MLAAGTLPSTSIPTRVTNVTASLIDNIFSTLGLKENPILVSDISDHFPIYSRFSFKQGESNRTQVFDSYSVRFGEKELSLLGSKLAENSWSLLDNDKDFSCLFESFYGTIKEAILSICKVPPSNHRSKRIVPLNPWMTSGLLKSWRRKNNLWRAYKCATLSARAVHLC